IGYLEQRIDRQTVISPIGGVVITPYLNEKIGQFLHDGDLICEVEDGSSLELEVALPEQDALRVRAGQNVSLKARATTGEVLTAHVVRTAPAASAGAGPGTQPALAGAASS